MDGFSSVDWDTVTGFFSATAASFWRVFIVRFVMAGPEVAGVFPVLPRILFGIVQAHHPLLSSRADVLIKETPSALR